MLLSRNSKIREMPRRKLWKRRGSRKNRKIKRRSQRKA
jgi:hypothetical protein